MGGIGFRELLVILVICLVVFGTKKLRTISADLGGAVRDFKKAMDGGEAQQNAQANPNAQNVPPSPPPPQLHQADAQFHGKNAAPTTTATPQAPNAGHASPPSEPPKA